MSAVNLSCLRLVGMKLNKSTMVFRSHAAIESHRSKNSHHLHTHPHQSRQLDTWMQMNKISRCIALRHFASCNFGAQVHLQAIHTSFSSLRSFLLRMLGAGLEKESRTCNQPKSFQPANIFIKPVCTFD